MTAQITPQDALAAFAQTWSEPDLIDELAGKLTCGEVAKLAAVLTAAGYSSAAEEWIQLHEEYDADVHQVHVG